MINNEWKKLPHNPKCHDQWEGVGVDAMIRKTGDDAAPQYEAYLRGKRVGTFGTLATAKKAVDRAL